MVVDNALEIAVVYLLAVAGIVDQEHDEHGAQDDEPDPAAGHGGAGAAAWLASRGRLTCGHDESSKLRRKPYLSDPEQFKGRALS